MRFILAASIVLAITSHATGVTAEPAAIERRTAVETNVLWPFFPGGISEFKLLVPAAMRGEALLGLWSDFANRKPARDETYGKVSSLAVKFGYRQHLGMGLHLEVAATIGWRHEAARPDDDPSIDDLVVRAWPFFGYQHVLSPRWYANARAGIGIHIYRTTRSDLERKLVPGGDINVGVRF